MMRRIPTVETAPLKILQSTYLNEGNSRLHMIQLDITSKTSIKAATAEIEKLRPVDIHYVKNNAGAVT